MEATVAHHPVAVPCSRCMTPLRLDTQTETISLTTPARGKGSKRVPASTRIEHTWNEPGLIVWQAPCCPDYIDSLDETELNQQTPWGRHARY